MTALVFFRVEDLCEGQPIETAPRDGTQVLVWAPGRDGLPSMFSLCAWHPDAGFCVDEFREPALWWPKPDDPASR